MTNIYVLNKKKPFGEIRLLVPEDNTGFCSRIGVRFACYLREEFAYKLALYDCLQIKGDATLAAGDIVYDGPGASSAARIYTVRVGYTADQARTDNEEYWVKLVAKILLQLAEENESEAEPIKLTEQRMLAEGSDVLIMLKSAAVKSGDYAIEPFIKIKGALGESATLLYVTLTEIPTGKKGTALVMEGSLLEVQAVADRFIVANGLLIVHPKRNAYIDGYRFRGFAVPIRKAVTDFIRA